MSQHVQQTVGTNMTKYLLDVQPGLFQVLAETKNGQTTRHIFDPLGGLHQIQQPSGAWQYPLRDGLGSVKAISDAGGNTLHSSLYGPFGDPIATTGDTQTAFGFTGEPTTGTGLVYLRARYYAPGLGVFPSLDPVEDGNRYAWVAGNAANRVDPSGMIAWDNPQNLSTPERRSDSRRYDAKIPAHGVIEVWLEQINGFWATQIEFPGAKARATKRPKIDTVIFNRLSQSGNSPIDFVSESVTANIYEIEPIAKKNGSANCKFDIDLDAILDGYAELIFRTNFFKMEFPVAGQISDYIADWTLGKDYFMAIRDTMNYSPTARFSWPNAMPIPGTSLSSATGKSSQRGPEIVSPHSLGLVNDSNVNFYWIMLPVDGLILYLPNNVFSEIIRGCAETLAYGITIDEVFKHLYHKAQRDAKRLRQKELPNSELWGPPPPLPSPVATAASCGLCIDPAVLQQLADSLGKSLDEIALLLGAGLAAGYGLGGGGGVCAFK